MVSHVLRRVPGNRFRETVPCPVGRNSRCSGFVGNAARIPANVSRRLARGSSEVAAGQRGAAPCPGNVPVEGFGSRRHLAGSWRASGAAVTWPATGMQSGSRGIEPPLPVPTCRTLPSMPWTQDTRRSICGQRLMAQGNVKRGTAKERRTVVGLSNNRGPALDAGHPTRCMRAAAHGPRQRDGGEPPGAENTCRPVQQSGSTSAVDGGRSRGPLSGADPCSDQGRPGHRKPPAPVSRIAPSGQPCSLTRAVRRGSACAGAARRCAWSIPAPELAIRASRTSGRRSGSPPAPRRGTRSGWMRWRGCGRRG